MACFAVEDATGEATRDFEAPLHASAQPTRAITAIASFMVVVLKERNEQDWWNEKKRQRMQKTTWWLQF
jgi:hypothetical protein